MLKTCIEENGHIWYCEWNTHGGDASRSIRGKLRLEVQCNPHVE